MNIDELVHICEQYNLSPSQVIYMYCLQNKEECPIKLKDTEIGALQLRGYIVRGQITDVWYKVVQKKTDRPIAVNLHTDLEPVLSHISTILIQHKVGTKTKSKIDESFINNDALSKLYYLWMCMFPTEGQESNSGWVDLFGVDYHGVRLRKFVQKHANNFKRQARKKDVDIGIYIMGTFMFIRSNINRGKAYIPAMDKFLDVQDDWYDTAEEYYETYGADGFYTLIDHSVTARFQQNVFPVYKALYQTLVPGEMPERMLSKLGKHFNGDMHTINAFYTWLNLFPTDSKSDNAKWEYLFNTKYDGTKIRVLSDSTLNKVKTMMRDEAFDMGAFIIATYLYIRAHIKDGKTFIPSIDKFFSVWESEYSQTLDKISRMNTAEIYALFDNTTTEKTVSSGASMI